MIINDKKIIKLPMRQTINYAVYMKMYKEHCRCPFCDSGDTSEDWEHWYGTKNHKNTLFDKKHYWKVIRFQCDKCRAVWETPPFREDYPDDVPYREGMEDEE